MYTSLTEEMLSVDILADTVIKRIIESQTSQDEDSQKEVKMSWQSKKNLILN